ncbi:hypothetical protein TSUD_236370 [Trifolium subterraneum]|nr:hypothetical protein TSUD_236370 [Trifolium subterraneum]
MGYDSDSASQDGRDEDDEEEYEESDKGNRFLGFMFGNVDNSGDLDVDYLDEDAKEHLSALADKLGPSLTDIDAVVPNLEIKMLSVDLLSGKSPRTPHGIVEQDCGEKAEDAVDYEDIDEEYDGPETETANEEDYLLPTKDFFAVEASLEALERKTSVFDDEDYDVESDKEEDIVNNDAKVDNISLAEHEESFVDASKGGSALEHGLQVGSLQTEELDSNVQKPEEGPEVLKRSMATPLPVLYVDDGKAVLRFSEIFGIQEPPRKGEKKERRHSTPRDRYKSLDLSDDIVEEDEEEFLKSFSQSLTLSKQVCVVHTDVSENNNVELEFPKFGFLHGDASPNVKDDRQSKDSCLGGEPMKGDFADDLSWKDHPLMLANFYPLDQRDWEDEILWGNSPVASDTDNNVESCEISGIELRASGGGETEIESGIQNLQSDPHKIVEEKDHSVFTCYSPVSLDPFGSRDSNGAETTSESLFHPQLLRLEVDSSHIADGRGADISERHNQSGQVKRLTMVMSQNRDLMDDSWIDKIMWEDLGRPKMKPKLIFDLQDNQMHFEVLDSKDSTHLRLHAGAMILSRSLKSISADSSEIPGHGGQFGWRYVANDKHYSNRKTSQQLKSNSKKRSAHGVKIFHSQPALKLQTMKLKLSK